jgi:hypothetical protein
MRISRWLNTAVLTLTLGVPVALFAQQPEERQEPKPELNQQEARPAEPARQPDVKPPKQDQAKPEKQDQNKADEKATKQQEKTDEKANEKAMKPGAGSRPAGKSAHIPDDKFRTNFGRQHTFVVHQPVVVEGRQQFVYGDYTFVFIDPWPADWAFTDQCYVDYIDGEYFLFDLLHPGIRIALFVSL